MRVFCNLLYHYSLLIMISMNHCLIQAALAAIVVVALKGLYLQVRDIYKYFKLSWVDMVSCVVTLQTNAHTVSYYQYYMHG